MPDHPEDLSQFRLPVDVRPTHYSLTIKTDLEKKVFQGYVVIEYERLALTIYFIDLVTASSLQSRCSPGDFVSSIQRVRSSHKGDHCVFRSP